METVSFFAVNTLVCAKKSDEKASRPDINFNLLATDYKGGFVFNSYDVKVILIGFIFGGNWL